jgi:serine/threonine protein kinase/tetratricopeptide (TPR) repeat protein
MNEPQKTDDATLELAPSDAAARAAASPTAAPALDATIDMAPGDQSAGGSPVPSADPALDATIDMAADGQAAEGSRLPSAEPALDATIELATSGQPAATAPPPSASPALASTLPLPPVEGGRSIRPQPSGAPLPATVELPPEGHAARQPGALAPGPSAGANRHPGLAATLAAEAVQHAAPEAVTLPADGRATPATHAPADQITRGGAEDTGVSRDAATHGAPQRDRKIVAGYEILGELGRGAMGVVYKARQLGLNRLVALKMVLAGAHASEGELARFSVEAEAVAGLQHPNIVQIFEVGRHDDLPYFSLEFVDGGSLAHRLEGKPQPPKEAARLMEALARGMACAHQQGVIHRDLKPANVLLTGDGVPKITDFGLAKRLESDSSQTRTGTLMGTPSYMAPEQAAGRTREVGPLSDQYALGAMLYEMLTGRPPLVGTTIAETLDLVQNKEPLPPSRLQPGVARDLETICLKCLQKEPAKRYDSTEALADDLARFRAGEPIQARPVSRAEQAWRWCKRNPRVAALSGTVLILLVLAGVAVTALVVNRAREREAEARRRDNERKALDETRDLARQRLDQATQTIKTGDHRRALDLLRWSTPLLDSAPDLDDLRTGLQDLRSQVEVYSEFKRMLDNARFASRFGTRRLKEQARQDCKDLVELDQELRERTRRGSAGLPPLNAEQLLLFQEDIFEAFLIAALMENDLAQGDAARKEAARRAIDWLNRADAVLPGTRVVYANRAICWGVLGNEEASQADRERARATVPTSAVDHFWHGFAHHLRANEARGKGDTKGAQEFYRKEIGEYAALLQLRPDNFWGYFNWANCQAELGNLHDAQVGYTACIRIRPDFPWPYNNRGTIHLRLVENQLAVQDYSAALALSDEYAEAHTNRGLAYHRLGQPELALADLDRAVALNPDYAPSYEYRAEVRRGQKQYGQAVEDYARLLGLTADRGPVYLKLADVHHDQGRDEAAVDDCTQAVALNPKNAQAIYKRAGFRVVCQDYARAREDYTTVLTLFPTALEPRRDRATLYWRYLKEFDLSLDDWEELTKRTPNDAEPQWNIGIIHMGRRQYDEALPALEKALELKPDYVGAVWALAEIALWKGDLKEALKVIDPLAEKLPPKAIETLNIRGDIYRAMGRLDAAAADYQRLIELRPALPEAYVNLAMVYERQKKPALATECYEKLVAANPDAAPAYLRRAAFRRAQGQFDAALKDCAQARTLDPKSVLPGLMEAGILAARGSDEEAVAKAEPLLAQASAGDGQALYTAACVWSLAARAAAARPDKTQATALVKRYTDRAASLLRECLDRGFHDLLYPEHNRMVEDPALEPVRQDPQVRDLLAHRR